MQRPNSAVSKTGAHRRVIHADEPHLSRHVIEALEDRLLLSTAPVPSKILHSVAQPAVVASPVVKTTTTAKSAVTSTSAKPVTMTASLMKKLKSQTVRAFGVTGVTSALLPAAGSGTVPSGDKTPAQLRGAYGLGQYGATNFTFSGAQASGAGQTIAIVDAYDYPTALSDLQHFDAAMGLPDPPSFTKVNQYGDQNNLPGVDPSGGWEVEEAVDIEYAHAMAPLANIILVEANAADLYDLILNGVDWARHVPGVSVISMSFGQGDLTLDANSIAFVDSYLTTPAGHQGITFVAATGDFGAYNPNSTSTTLDPNYPATSPNVVAVGGTSLTLTNSNTGLGWASEVGWENPVKNGTQHGSGGGVSIYESQPSYQHNNVNGVASTKRAIPDVSAEADPNAPGVALYNSYVYGASTPWLDTAEGGTSLSAPLWAGLVAVANQGRAVGGQPSFDGRSELLPALYSLRSNSADFHDITTGTSGGTAKYNTTTGYDLVTGIGSPKAAGLIPDLIAAASVPVITSFNVTPNVQNSSGGSETLSIAVSSSSPIVEVDYYLEYNGTQNSVSPGLQISSAPVNDFLLGSAFDSAGGFPLNIGTYSGLANGTYILYAVATSANGSSEPVIGDGTFTAGSGTAPTIGSLTAPSSVLVGSTINLVASAINDSTGTAQYVSFWRESNNTAGLQVGPGGDTPVGVAGIPSDTSNPNGSNWAINAIAPTTPGAYTYYAQATDYNPSNAYQIISSADGISAKSVAVVVTGVGLTAAASQKVQGSAGTFSLPLDISGIAANATVEPRRFNSGDQIVFTFSSNIRGSGAGGAPNLSDVTASNAVVSGASISGNVLTLTLASVTDMSVVSVSLSGITDMFGNALVGSNTVFIRALEGDVNRNKLVSIGDLGAVNSQIAVALNSNNYLDDVNCNGIISIGDLGDINSHIGDSIA